MASLRNVLREIQALYAPGPARTQVWYILAAVVMTTLNRAQDIPDVYHTVEQAMAPAAPVEERTSVILRMREGIFKSSVVVGYPKVINSLQALASVTPDEVLARLPKSPIRSESSWEQVLDQRERGQRLFDTIYERHSQRVVEQMQSAYPDLAQTAIHHLYGPVLAETSIVSAKETSLLMVASLMVQDVPPQLKGHRYGALHHGATQQELGHVETLVHTLCRYYAV